MEDEEEEESSIDELALSPSDPVQYTSICTVRGCLPVLTDEADF